MKAKDLDSLGDFSMADLFRMEIETQSATLTQGLIAWEDDPSAGKLLEELMRAAHSAKGAARIVNRNSAVRVAHSMEDCFVAAQEGHTAIPPEKIDILLQGVDLLGRISKVPEDAFDGWELEHETEISAFLAALAHRNEGQGTFTLRAVPDTALTVEGVTEPEHKSPEGEPTGQSAARSGNTAQPVTSTDRVLRVSAENLNHLLGLAGEALVASRWLDAFAARMLRMKRLQRELGQSVENLRGSLIASNLEDRTAGRLSELQGRATTCQRFLTDTIADLDLFDRRFVNLSTRLYEEVLNSRMRPFAEGAQGFPRVVRDLARSLGKEAKLVTLGATTTVDRDILERLKAPLDHLVRNAVDHGIEFPDDRQRAGKPEEGTVQLEARHSAGALLVTVADDGRGIDPQTVREAVVERKLAKAETAGKMSEAELMEFLFLPDLP